MNHHRGQCREPGCGWFRRENCAECLDELVDRHRADTGHAVDVVVTRDPEGLSRMIVAAGASMHRIGGGGRRW